VAVSRIHALRQGPVVRALLGAGLAALNRERPREVALPGPVSRARVRPRNPDLVRDYVRHSGGDPSWYRGVLPGHLFPQWGFPLLATTLRGVPYDLRTVLNGGCRIEMHAPLPAGEALELEACLEDIDDNGRRAVIKNRLTTGTRSAPGALDAWMYAVVPLARGDKGAKKERPTVPRDAHELGRWRLTPQNAVDFAMLTGDFNPVHWLKPYARAAGFKSTILHGFATLAYAIEGLNQNRFSGDPTRLAVIDVKFTRPLILPARAGLYVRERELLVGSAPGGPAYLTGVFQERSDV
jgi:acyl dehydratase